MTLAQYIVFVIFFALGFWRVWKRRKKKEGRKTA